MPFKSKSQERLFQAVANNKKFADKVDMKQSMAKKFIKDSKIKMIVSNAGATNTIVVYGRIQGQKTWDVIDSIVGSITKEINVKDFDFIRMECTVFDGSYIGVVGSGFNYASGGGLETVSTPSGDLTNIETLEFTSSDNSVVIEAISPNQVNLKMSGTAGNAFGNFSTPDGNTVVANSFSDSMSFKEVSEATVITGNTLTSEITVDIAPKIKNNVVITEKFTLTALDITNKTITLANIVATPFKTRLFIAGGPEQQILDDFTVSGNLLGWSGTNLDGVLEVGDELTVTHD